MCIALFVYSCIILWLSINIFTVGIVSIYLVYVHYTAPRPTMNELITMDCKDGSGEKLQIIRWITSHPSTQCSDFALMLLQHSPTVRELRKRHGNDDDEFVRAVLRQWLSRDDDDILEPSVPCTWESLIKCVEDAGLAGEFFKLLRENVPK